MIYLIKSFNFWIAHIKKLKYLRYLQGGNFTLKICSYLHIWVIVVTLTSQKNIFRTLQKVPPKTHHQNHLNPLKIFVQNPRIKTINTINTHIIKPIIPKKYLIQKQPQTSSIKHTIKHTVTKHLHLSITRINTHDNTLLPYYYQIPTNRNHFSQYYRHYLKSPNWHKKYTQNTRKITLYYQWYII